MKLERFTNPYELEDYLKVMILSMYDGKRKHKPITRFFRQEITRAFEHTAKLDDNYEINKGNWVLYALRNDYNEIVGTIAAGEDYHFDSILSTIHEGGFYEKAGMNLAGTLTADGYTRCFYTRKI